jgi:hypothetical protein
MMDMFRLHQLCHDVLAGKPKSEAELFDFFLNVDLDDPRLESLGMGLNTAIIRNVVDIDGNVVLTSMISTDDPIIVGGTP